MKIKTLTYYLVILLGLNLSGSGIVAAKENHISLSISSDTGLNVCGMSSCDNMILDLPDAYSVDKISAGKMTTTPQANIYSDFYQDKIFLTEHGSALIENSFFQNIGSKTILTI